MISWNLVLLAFLMSLIGMVIIAPLGWLLERMRMPERQKQGGLPRFVGQNVFIFFMLFGATSLLVIDLPDNRNSWWFALLLLAAVAGLPLAISLLVSRWLRQRQEKRDQARIASCSGRTG